VYFGHVSLKKNKELFSNFLFGFDLDCKKHVYLLQKKNLHANSTFKSIGKRSWSAPDINSDLVEKKSKNWMLYKEW
jgi:hypothetical protein